MNAALAITWFQHRRMEGLCAGLGIELHTLISPYRGLRRYAGLARRTFGLLRSRRPKLLLVQNPSLVLAAFALAVRPLFGYRLVVDAHNEAVEPYINRKAWFLRLTASLLRRADATIVTNRWLGQLVEAAGGRAFVLPDPVPEVGPTKPGCDGWREDRSLRIVAIATYAPDEPIANLFAAAARLPEVQFAFTGNQHKLAPEALARAPANVRFTGFLPEDSYWTLLTTAHGIIDLTLMDNCLVCGAYEAVAAAKPAVLSDNPACRDLFGKTAIFTGPAPEEIAAAIDALRRGEMDEARVRAGGAELRRTWAREVAALRGQCQRLVEAS